MKLKLLEKNKQNSRKEPPGTKLLTSELNEYVSKFRILCMTKEIYYKI